MRALYVSVLSIPLLVSEVNAEDVCDGFLDREGPAGLKVTTTEDQQRLNECLKNSIEEFQALSTELKLKLEQIDEQRSVDQQIFDTRYKFPSGAVVGFDREDGCPQNWSSFDEGAGRFIIGTDKSRFRLLHEAGRPVYQQGGSLEHNHGIYLSLAEGAGRELFWHHESAATNLVASGSPRPGSNPESNKVNTGSNGSLPPFVALNFCKKD